MSRGRRHPQGDGRRIRRLTALKDRAQLRDMLKDAAQHGLLDTDALSMVEGVLDVAETCRCATSWCRTTR